MMFNRVIYELLVAFLISLYTVPSYLPFVICLLRAAA